MTVEYDLPVLLDGNVASIEAKLPELSDAQLMALAELEEGGKTRVTLLAAIKAELEGRAQAAAIAAGAPLTEQLETESAGESEQASADLPSEAGDETPVVEPGPDAGDTQDGTFVDAPHPDLAVNDRGQLPLHVLREALEDAGYEIPEGESTLLFAATAVTELSHALLNAVMNGPAASNSEIVPPEGALAPLELSADADGDSALIVMFEGIGGRPIPALGKLTFTPGDFVQDTGSKAKVLARPIVFPTDIAPTQVVAVWLLDDDGEPWSRCPIVGRFDVGGQRQSSIPANFLRFDAPAQVKAAA